MELSLLFFVESIALGVGLAMDAFSVSLADGMHEPCIRRGKMVGIAALFAFFQAAMPLIGWVCVHTIVEIFLGFSSFIPWIALALLVIIGGKMLLDGIRNKEEECACAAVGIGAIIVQAVATSIDALSVGFTIAEYDLLFAILAALIIAAVTFPICLLGVFIGKKFGDKLSCRAQIFGGVVLILIGIEIFITGLLG